MIGHLFFVLFCVLVGSAVGWWLGGLRWPRGGETPAAEGPDESCRFDLRKFGEQQFPEIFPPGQWTNEHLRAIVAIEHMILFGGQAEVALPFPRTSLAIVAALWSYVYGHRRYSVLFFRAGGGVAAAEQAWIDRYLDTLSRDSGKQGRIECRVMKDGLHGAEWHDGERTVRPDLLLFVAPYERHLQTSANDRCRRTYDRICGFAWHSHTSPKNLGLVALFPPDTDAQKQRATQRLETHLL